MFHDLFSSQSKARRKPKSIPVTLSTRIRLARNLREYPFPGRAETSQKRAVLTKCMDALSDVKGLNQSLSVEVDDLSELELRKLAGRPCLEGVGKEAGG